MNGLPLMLVAASIAAGGCFRPPLAQPPSTFNSRAIVGAPYDLAWDAVHEVIKKNKYKLQADDPDHGIVEAEAVSFGLAEADCGQIESIVGRYREEPGRDATAVYSFKVETSGPNASVVMVNATFSAPIHVPLHPPRDFQCVSRGVAEARLLKEIEVQVRTEHRPVPVKASPAAPSGMPALPPVPKFAPLAPGRPMLLRSAPAEPSLQ